MAALDSAASDGWMAKVTLEYDGAGFAGSQYQTDQRTVQGVVEEALTHLTGASRRITLAGRTDTGVHASGQVASVPVPVRWTPARLRQGLNALLPDDVVAVAVEPVAATFHARFSAVQRRYAYQIWNAPVPSPLRRTTSWHVRGALAIEEMQAAANHLLGTHDYASFAGAGRGVPGRDGRTVATQRTIARITIDVVDETSYGRLIQIGIEAESFLPHMVRNIAGALVAVGKGVWAVETMRQVLVAADRRQSAPTAPPQGVILVEVIYMPCAGEQVVDTVERSRS